MPDGVRDRAGVGNCLGALDCETVFVCVFDRVGVLESVRLWRGEVEAERKTGIDRATEVATDGVPEDDADADAGASLSDWLAV